MKNTLVFFLVSLLLWGACTSSKRTVRATPPVPKTVNKSLPSAKPDVFADTNTVQKMQLILYLSGYEPGHADGIFKETTAASLHEFKQAKQINASDRSDTTLRALGIQLMTFNIKDLQEALAQKGYDPGPVDNLVGPMTRNAYTEFLQNNELNPIGLTEEAREALLSKDPKFIRTAPNTDPLFRETSRHIIAASSNIRIKDAELRDIQKALKAFGYESGEESTDQLTPALSDALYLFQIDRKLPIGGFNYETMKALGFKD